MVAEGRRVAVLQQRSRPEIQETIDLGRWKLGFGIDETSELEPDSTAVWGPVGIAATGGGRWWGRIPWQRLSGCVAWLAYGWNGYKAGRG